MKEVNNETKKQIKNVMEYYGHAPFGLRSYSSSLLTMNSISNVQVTLFCKDDKIEGEVQKLLVEKIGVVDKS